MQVLLSQYTHVCKCTHVLDPIVHTSIFSWCYIHTLASHFILVCAVWRSRPPNRPCPASGDLRPPASRLRRPPLGTGTGPYYFCIIGGASLYYVLYKYKYVFVFIMYYVLCYPGWKRCWSLACGGIGSWNTVGMRMTATCDKNGHETRGWHLMALR